MWAQAGRVHYLNGSSFQSGARPTQPRLKTQSATLILPWDLQGIFYFRGRKQVLLMSALSPEGKKDTNEMHLIATSTRIYENLPQKS